MNPLPYKSTLLHLYTRIMRAHKRMPTQFQSLGNQYVRAEFATMKKVEKKEQVEIFLKEWNQYVDTIELQIRKRSFGAELRMSHLERMNEDQKAKLLQMRDQTVKKK